MFVHQNKSHIPICISCIRIHQPRNHHHNQLRNLHLLPKVGFLHRRLSKYGIFFDRFCQDCSFYLIQDRIQYSRMSHSSHILESSIHLDVDHVFQMNLDEYTSQRIFLVHNHESFLIPNSQGHSPFLQHTRSSIEDVLHR